ncbi:unnamed protein product [Gongylonema pulchrum]|uniref:Dirigent protein n=1 Tax=Gongylonema pulchrum TaxID=637853 RepID=A0A183DXX9_9BILA|nr:unnamed protein product [Gongylonema pulchrum]
MLMAVISPGPDTSKHEDKNLVRSRTFPGTGELDMLVGFFVMNGACIAEGGIYGSSPFVLEQDACSHSLLKLRPIEFDYFTNNFSLQLSFFSSAHVS